MGRLEAAIAAGRRLELDVSGAEATREALLRAAAAEAALLASLRDREGNTLAHACVGSEALCAQRSRLLDRL